MWVFQKSEPNLWTVGFYTPGWVDQPPKWVSEGDYSTPQEAASRVHYLNGGGK